MILIFRERFIYIFQSLVLAALLTSIMAVAAQNPSTTSNDPILCEEDTDLVEKLSLINPTTDTEALATLTTTHPEAAIYGVLVSPDKTKMLVLLYEATATDLYLLNVDTGTIERLTDDTYIEFDPIWSPDGSHIAFLSDKGDDVEDVYIHVMDLEARTVRRITTHLKGGKTNLAWSPDGSRLLFQSVFFGAWIYRGYNTFVIGVDGTNRQRLFKGRFDEIASELDLAWSPDGTHIVFSRDENLEGNELNIYIVDANGMHTQRITELAGNETDAKWSPDGSQIAFIQRGDLSQGHHIYVMNTDGSALHRLTPIPLFIVDFNWLPDGTQLIITGTQDLTSSQSLYIISLDTGDLCRLAEH